MKRGNDAVSALDLFVVGYTKVNIEVGSDFGLPIKDACSLEEKL